MSEYGLRLNDAMTPAQIEADRKRRDAEHAAKIAKENADKAKGMGLGPRHGTTREHGRSGGRSRRKRTRRKVSRKSRRSRRSRRRR